MQRKILLILIIAVLVSAAYFLWPRGVPEEKEVPGNETIVPAEAAWCTAENSSITTVTGLKIDKITEITVDEKGIAYCTITTKNNGIISTRELVSKDGSIRIYEQYDEKGEIESKTVISEDCTVVYDRAGEEISRICK